MSKNHGIIAGFFSTIFIGFSIVIASVASKIINPLVVAFLSMLISLPFLYIFLVSSRNHSQIRKMFSQFPKDTISVILLRSVIGTIILLVGFSLTIAMRAVFLLRLEPFFVLLMSVFILKEKITKRRILYLVLLLFGALIFLTNGVLTDLFHAVNLGDVLIIISLVFLAYTYIPTSRIMKKFDPINLTVSSNIFGGIIILIVSLLFLPVSGFAIDSYGISLLLIYSLSFYVIGQFLWFRALKDTKPWILSSILALEPISGALLAYFWLNQILQPMQLVGAVIMILMTYFISKENA